MPNPEFDPGEYPKDPAMRERITLLNPASFGTSALPPLADQLEYLEDLRLSAAGQRLASVKEAEEVVHKRLASIAGTEARWARGAIWSATTPLIFIHKSAFM